MKLIVCVDARGGMAFNGRRVSSDREVSCRILALGDGCLRMAPYSRGLFPKNGEIYAADDFLRSAGNNDLCFIEREAADPWLCKADTLILFCWNRAYPYDLRFPLDRLTDGWKLVATEDFPGNSHERITVEVYEKC